MARTKGSFSLAGAIEPLISAPLDARNKVATKAELTVSGNFPYPYVGMETYVVSEDKKYRLVGEDPTNIENWKEVKEGDGTTDYPDLENKPSIENVTLEGNKSASDLGLAKSSDIPTKVSQLTNDSGFISSETDPTVPSWAKQSSKPSYTKSEVGLGSVDNTSDADKPVSTAQQTALDAKQAKLQFETLPTASADYAGKIVEYIGATDNGLTHGYFYECKESNGTYSWVQTNVQPSGGGGGSYTAGDGISIENDEISIDPMPAEDVDEVIDVYPTAGNLVSIVNAFNKGDLYSTEERMIGQWIDGKPLYQRTFDLGSDVIISATSWTDTTIDGSAFASLIQAKGVNSGGACCPLLAVIDGTSHIVKLEASRNGTNIVIRYVILQYIKTTDTAISIGEATEYSTEEKIVGTWIDGKPLWQKTITGVAPSSSATQNIQIGVNVENALVVSGYCRHDSFLTPVNIQIDSNEYFLAWIRDNTNPNAPNTIGIKVGSSLYGSSYNLTLQYTKTTT